MISLEKKTAREVQWPQNHQFLIAHQESHVQNRTQRIDHYIEKDQFKFRKGKETMDALGVLRIISERCPDVIAFDGVNCNKLMLPSHRKGNEHYETCTLNWRTRCDWTKARPTLSRLLRFCFIDGGSSTRHSRRWRRKDHYHKICRRSGEFVQNPGRTAVDTIVGAGKNTK